MHDLLATKVATDLRDRIDANYSGAMNLPELVRIELVDQLLDRLADQRLEGLGLHTSVFILGAEEKDLAGWNHADIRAHAGLNPSHVLARLETSAAESLRKLLQQIVHRIRLCLQPLAQAPAGERDALRLHGLEQVIDRAMVEGIDGILVVGGDEDQMRLSGERLCSLDTVHLGHVDIEKDDIRFEAVHHDDRLAAIAGLTHDLQFGPRFLQAAGNLLAHQAFIIDDDGGGDGFGVHAITRRIKRRQGQSRTVL